jgi:glycosyltransferase involved in cell wall biosynthesis
MEAMSCGLPVVASRISGIPELIEHERSGLLTPPGDASAIAAALARLAGSPELRARLGREAREVVRRDFDLHAGAQRLAEEIRAVRSQRAHDSAEPARR